MRHDPNRPLIFLMAAVVSADAARTDDGRVRPASRKLRKMDAILSHRFSELAPQERWQTVSRALNGMPEMDNGLDFLKLTERQARRLSRILEGKERRVRKVLSYLISIAEADDEISSQELLVLQTAASAMGAAGALQVGEDEWGERTLQVA